MELMQVREAVKIYDVLPSVVERIITQPLGITRQRSHCTGEIASKRNQKLTDRILPDSA